MSVTLDNELVELHPLPVLVLGGHVDLEAVLGPVLGLAAGAVVLAPIVEVGVFDVHPNAGIGEDPPAQGAETPCRGRRRVRAHQVPYAVL